MLSTNLSTTLWIGQLIAELLALSLREVAINIDICSTLATNEDL
jgi:hypothetical protein